MAFYDDLRLPDDVERGATGGPEFKTDIAELFNGYEKRSIYWTMPLGSWNVGYGIQNIDNLEDVKSLFYIAKGRAHGFRFKDWSDFELEDQELQGLDGQTTVIQLIKTYDLGTESFKRDIKKPVNGTLTFELNGNSYSPNSVDYSNGEVTLSPKQTLSITNATQTNPVQVDFNSVHNLSTGDYIRIENVNGMTELNGSYYQITVVDTDSVTLDGIDGTGFNAYTDSGDGIEYPQDDDTLTVTGEFDVPVRFDLDKFDVNMELFNAGSVPQINIREIRQ